jgi:hypothetical protein
VGVEPTIPSAKDGIAGFEGRGSHRTPFASAVYGTLRLRSLVQVCNLQPSDNKAGAAVDPPLLYLSGLEGKEVKGKARVYSDSGTGPARFEGAHRPGEIHGHARVRAGRDPKWNTGDKIRPRRDVHKRLGSGPMNNWRWCYWPAWAGSAARCVRTRAATKS